MKRFRACSARRRVGRNSSACTTFFAGRCLDQTPARPDVPPVQLVSRRVYILPDRGRHRLRRHGAGHAHRRHQLRQQPRPLPHVPARAASRWSPCISAIAISCARRSSARRRSRPSRERPEHCASSCRTMRPSCAMASRSTPPDQDAGQGDIRPRGQVADRRRRCDAPKRGIVRIDRLKISTTFPFGLFRAWSWVHMPIEMIVYPRAARLAADAHGQRLQIRPALAGPCRLRRMARPAPLSRRRLAAAGGLESLCARRAAAREGIQRDGRRAARVRFLARSSSSASKRGSSSSRAG